MTTTNFEDMKFNEKEKAYYLSLISGYTMGDGYIAPGGSLQVEQGEDQKSFVLWMQTQLQPFLSDKGKKEPEKVHRKTEDRKETISFRFYTKNHFKSFHKAWYRKVEGKNPKTGKQGGYLKKLPDNLRDIFNPVFITIWYACDGSKEPLDTSGRRVKFALDSYQTVQERLTLKTLFFDLYNIEASINEDGYSKVKVRDDKGNVVKGPDGTPLYEKGQKQWKLNISAKSYTTFEKLILEKSKLDLIPKLFPHKLHKRING